MPSSSTFHAALQHYAASSADAAVTAKLFLDFLRSAGTVFERHHFPGHFTGSAWLVSADGQRVLLTQHRKLGRWLQLGGHADGEADLAQVALREAEEESGLVGLRIEPEIFDLDHHEIPARGPEPAHWHYDVRYVVRALGGETFSVSAESLALAWRQIDELVTDPSLDPSIQRMARRWLHRTKACRSQGGGAQVSRGDAR